MNYLDITSGEICCEIKKNDITERSVQGNCRTYKKEQQTI